MSETQATTNPNAAVFPAGRYGHRRQPRRRTHWLPVLVAAIVLIGTVAIALRLYDQYGDPTYDGDVIRITELNDSGATVAFAVIVPAGGAATCTLRARTSDGQEISRERVTVRADPGQRTAGTTFRLTTTTRPHAIDMPGCGPADRG